MNKHTFVLFLVALLFFTQTAFSQHAFNPRPINFNLTAEQWRQDLRYFAKELPLRHRNAFHLMTRERFEKAVSSFDADIPKLTHAEIFVRFLKLISMVGDGHTSIEEASLLGLGVYPIRFEVMQGKLFVTSADSSYSEIVGGNVTRIGDTAVADALKRVGDIAWGDGLNEQSRKVETAFLLSSPKVLKGLKIVPSDDAMPLTVEKEGRVSVVEVKAVKDVVNYMRTAKRVNAFDGAANPLPLYLKDRNNNYWFELVKDKRVLYVQFNSVENKPEESIASFFKRVFEIADSGAVDKLVLDVRANTGGNNQLNRPVVVGLIRSRLNDRGKLFVITGRRTFSAAQNLVNEIEKFTEAIFVGEPTGSSPNLYGDPVVMTLPNSGMPFRVSTLWHQIDPNDRRPFTAPEIFAEVTPDDYRKNIDPALDAVLNYSPGKTFKDITAIALSDMQLFISRYRAFKSDAANKFANTERETNALGYRLIGAKRFGDAVEVLKLNVESYPASANAFDSLGEAYLLAGNRDEAIRSYKKAVEIDPNFRSSLDALAKIHGQ
jgi:tetratricopeptide (TPR) repeat protein